MLRVGLDETILQAFTTVLDALHAESTGFAQIAAAEMLRDSPMSVKQIAVALGFRNPHSFSRLFKLKTGSSPRDYHQHWRGMQPPPR